MYLPSSTLISGITQAENAVVEVSTINGLSIGQYVRFFIPKLFGMQQINGIAGKIISVDAIGITVTVDVNTLSMDPFIFYSGPLNFTPAQLIPFGDGLDPTMPFQTSATLSGSTRNIL